jgi:peroxiredoxin
LRRWEELRPELDARGVDIVTVSGDEPEAIRKGRYKHGAKATMLSDADLALTTRLNLLNMRALSPSGIGTLPIPTTFLVDAEGVVRWIDQSEDYQIRSEPGRVLSAIEAGLG